MKNLKKTLCLVLVIAMVCSLFVSVNAAAFKDQADIDNATAAAVLNEIGVITGYTDGSFKPEGILTRAEGATIIARLLLGDKADDQMAAGNPFDDVKATDWHAGYIAYCVAEGIAAGYGNGKFGPNDTLTVAQFGKMLLNALGYESAREGFTGADWATPVGKYINKLGLAEGATTTLNASCTRQVAAQMALNTLKADMVEYATGSTTIKGEGIEVTVGGSAATKVDAAKNVNDGKIDNDDVLQFAEQYFTSLQLDTPKTAAFGRPAVRTWKYRNNPLGEEASKSELLKTYAGSVTRGALFDLVGEDTVEDLKKNSTVTVWIDGTKVSVADTALLFSDTNATKGSTITCTSDKAKDGYYPTGNGVVTEVYMGENDKDGYDITIVIINTYVAVAAADYDEEEKTLEVDVKGAVAAGIPANGTTLSAEDYDVAGYEEGDFLLVTVDTKNGGAAEIATIAPAKTVSGTIDTYTFHSTEDHLNTITVGGKKYSYSKKQIDTNNGDASTVNTSMRGTDITLVLDAAGYVITFAESEVVSNYLYLTEIASESSFTSSKNSFIGAVYFTDGTYEEVAIAKKDGNTTMTEGVVGGWYTYSVNAEGKYILNAVDNAINNSYEDTAVNGGKTVFYGNERANTKTTFVVVDEEGETTVFTGYKNMSNVVVDEVVDLCTDEHHEEACAADCTTEHAHKNTCELTAAALTIDVLFDEDTKFAEYVFVGPANDNTKVLVSGATKDITTVVYIYRAGSFVKSIDAEDNEFFTNNYALVNGVRTAINTEDGDAKYGVGLYIGVEYDNVTGYIKDMTKVEAPYDANEWLPGDKADDAIILSLNITGTNIVFDGEILVLGTEDYAIAEDCEIILVEGDNYSKISMSKLTALKAGTATISGVVNAEGQITALYVDYTKA